MQLFRSSITLVAPAAVTNVSAIAQCANDADCYNRREPGSLLLYPEYQNGQGRVTVVTVTNTNCDALDGEVEVEFKYIQGSNCLEANQAVTLTPCDTFTVLTSAHTGIDEGYLYVFARDSSNPTPVNPPGSPIVFNHLIGQLLVVDGFTSFEYSTNAVSFKGVGEQGEVTDRENPGLSGGIGDGIRDLDGVEYEPAPEKILIPRFIGQRAPNDRDGVDSELILIALSGGRQFEANQIIPGGGTTILIHGWNDNEVMFSREYTFTCWDKVYLRDITTAYQSSNLRGINDDDTEVAGAPGLETGWFWVNGLSASSSSETIVDPAVYGVLVEYVRGQAAADLPFELCSQNNGDLLPNSNFGDFPFSSTDNQ